MTQGILDEQEASAGEILAKLQEHVLLVAMHIGWPKLSPHIADANVVVTNGTEVKHVSEKFRSSPRWALIPEEWRSKIGKLEGQARRCLSQFSRQFTSKGLNLLPISRADQVFAQLRSMRVEFLATADQFCSHYTDILADIRRDLIAEIGEDRAKEALSTLPTVSEVRDKFRFTWYTLPLAGSVSAGKVQELKQMVRRMMTETNGHTADDLLSSLDRLTEAEDGTRTAYSELIQEARHALQSQIHDMVEDLVAAPRQAVAEEMQKVIEKLREGKPIKDATFNALRESLEHLQGFSFLDTQQLQEALTVVHKKIDENDAQKLSQQRDLGLQLANALSQQVSRIMDPGDMRSAARGFRRVQMASPDLDASLV